MLSRPSRAALTLSLLLPLALAACGGGNNGSVKPIADLGTNDPSSVGPGALAGARKTNDAQETGTTLGVNAFLWRGALETLGFMPLASADPFGGVIVTDWYSPPTTQGERFKATAYVLGRQLRTDAIKVTIFRQVRDGEQWEDAPVNPATAADIESKVLARARELKAQSTASR